jgi:hypothetical protein
VSSFGFDQYQTAVRELITIAGRAAAAVRSAAAQGS